MQIKSENSQFSYKTNKCNFSCKQNLRDSNFHINTLTFRYKTLANIFWSISMYKDVLVSIITAIPINDKCCVISSVLFHPKNYTNSLLFISYCCKKLH